MRGFFFPIRVTDFGQIGHGFRTRGRSRILDGFARVLDKRAIAWRGLAGATETISIGDGVMVGLLFGAFAEPRVCGDTGDMGKAW